MIGVEPENRRAGLHAAESTGVVVAILIVALSVPAQGHLPLGSFPIQLEPYRLVILLALFSWLLSLLISPARFRLRRTGVRGPIGLYLFGVAGSIAFNLDRVGNPNSSTLRSLSYVAVFVVVMVFVACTIVRLESLILVLRVLVLVGATLAVLAVVERQTGWTPFGPLADLLHLARDAQTDAFRSADSRARGPTEHPIALGALLMLLVPTAISLAMTRSRMWWAPVLILIIGSIATQSRTPVVMLATATVVLLLLKRQEMAPYAVLLVPLVVAIHFAMPGALGSLRSAFFPQGGLISEQSSSAGSLSSSGRIADLSPAFDEFSERPLFGFGIGTRIVSGPSANAPILDDQWLGLLLDVGLLGALGIAWLFWRFVARMAYLGRRDSSPVGWTAAALAASVAAYAIGMITFDAFAFTQVTLVMFVLLGLGSSLALAEGAIAESRELRVEPRITVAGAGHPTARFR